MDLWIRSQDKERIIKIDRIDINRSNGLYQIWANGFNVKVAEYGNYKKALEVLNKIQSILTSKIITTTTEPKENIRDAIYSGISQQVDMKIQELSTLVYQMPKE